MLLYLMTQTTRDHLRVCGADRPTRTPTGRRRGSSPRVRSRRTVRGCASRPRGIISACAEQTSQAQSNATAAKDHLRVCGADALNLGGAEQHEGSSPRVRSRPQQVPQAGAASGIISACAEQTTGGTSQASIPRDHLRVCGADYAMPTGGVSGFGSSPRVRSRPLYVNAYGRKVRIISACAEQTGRCPPPCR